MTNIGVNRRELRAEEEATLAALASAFRPSLIKFFCRRIKEREDVEDLAQEVLLRLVRRGGAKDIENLSGYVFTMASNVMTDWLRKRRSGGLDPDNREDPMQQSNADFGPDRLLIGKEGLALATAALMELPERTRTIFILRRIEGIAYKDIARHFGLSVSSVEKHVRRAMAHLLRRLEH